ncbi:MAG: NTPase [Nitrososphaerales archaeon]
MKTKFWLTGIPGVGKTKILSRIVLTIRSQGFTIGGVVTREVKVRGRREGFDIVDLRTDRTARLAAINQKTGPPVGKYRISLRALEEIGVSAMSTAVSHSDLIVCDEIGPMELCSPEFKRASTLAVRSSKPMLGVLHLRLNDPLIQESRNMPDAEVFEVTIENREDLHDILAPRILSLLKNS